ncbi:MAG: hypothetical protein ACLP6E_00270 [Acidimicrobiales bacterium]
MPRQANLHLLGSGQGSVGATGILGELPALAAKISDGTIDVNVRTVPLCR